MRNGARKFALLAACTATLFGASPVAAQDIVIGAGFPLTGIGASYGEDAKAGVEIAIAHINATGAPLGRKLRVDYEETATDRAKAAAAYRRFASRPDVVAMMSLSSIEFVALNPIADEVKLPLLSLGSNIPFEKFSPWSFRVQLIVGKAMPTVLQQLKELKGIKSVAIIYDSANNSSVGEMEAVKGAASKAGIEIKAVESFTMGEQNFSLHLTRISAGKPDLLYVGAITNEAMLIVRQARSLGMTALILGGAGLNDPRIGTLPNNAGQGVMTFFPFDPRDPRPAVQNFVRLYAAKYQKATPPAYAALGYDAVALLADAIKRAGSADRDAIRIALGRTSAFEGMNGPFRYEGSGDNLAQRPFIFAYRGTSIERISK